MAYRSGGYLKAFDHPKGVNKNTVRHKKVRYACFATLKSTVNRISMLRKSLKKYGLPERFGLQGASCVAVTSCVSVTSCAGVNGGYSVVTTG